VEIFFDYEYKKTQLWGSLTLKPRFFSYKYEQSFPSSMVLGCGVYLSFFLGVKSKGVEKLVCEGSVFQIE